MLSRIRSRLSYANIVATLALFFVLAGGTAFGVTYVVSSNSQIGPNTVSGHAPPTGKHANIIGGSVNGTDLASGAVTNAKIGTAAVSQGKLAGNSVNSAKVVNGSLTGSDIGSNTITSSNLDLSEVSNALQVQTARDGAVPGDPPVVFYNKGNYELTGTCENGMGTFDAKVDLTVKNGPGFVSIDNNNGSRVTGPAGTIAQTGNVMNSSGQTAVKGGTFSVDSVQFANKLGGQVLAVADDDPTDFGGAAPVCVFDFEGVGF